MLQLLFDPVDCAQFSAQMYSYSRVDCCWCTSGICRSHGILHQKVSDAKDLGAALKMAWGSNNHSVVEVVTDRCVE